MTGGGGGGGGAGAGGEFKPKAAFRAYAAARHDMPPGDFEGGADDAATAASEEHSRGRAWQFHMWHRTDRYTVVRGWATADGTVIAPDQNLGLLFVEEGVWARPPRMPLDKLAMQLAADLVWSYGPGTTLETMQAFGLGPPELVLAADGSGKLHFFSNDHGGAMPGMGGGAPPDTYWENTVVLTADHTATLTKVPFKARSDG